MLRFQDLPAPGGHCNADVLGPGIDPDAPLLGGTPGLVSQMDRERVPADDRSFILFQ